MQVPDDCLIATATTDGASNEVLAAEEIVSKNGDRFCCAAHSVQLCVNKALKSGPLHQVLVAARAFSISVRNSSAIQRVFNDIGLNNTLAPVVTRWNSEYMMVCRLLELRAELKPLLRDQGIPFDFRLPNSAFIAMHRLCRLLRPFDLFTKRVQRKTSPTFCYLPFWVDNLVTRIKGVAKGMPREFMVVAETMIELVEEKFDWVFEKHSLALAASLLLPGHSLNALEHFKLKESVITSAEERLLHEALLMADPDADLIEAEKASLRIYFTPMRSRLLSASPQISPLAWWAENSKDRTLFQKVARVLLAIPASTAENERVFSSSAFVLEGRENLSECRLAMECIIRHYAAQQEDFAFYLSQIDDLEPRAPQVPNSSSQSSHIVIN